jgi:hypothetical protein
MRIEGALLGDLPDLRLAGGHGLHPLAHHCAVMAAMAPAAYRKAGFRVRGGRLEQRRGVETADQGKHQDGYEFP